MKLTKINFLIENGKEGRDSPNGPRDMYQSICAIQKGQCGLMSFHEPMLDIMFLQWEQEAEQAVLLKFQNRYTMGLGNIDNLPRENHL